MKLFKIYNYFKRPFVIRKLFLKELENYDKVSSNKVVFNAIRFLPDTFLLELNLSLILIKAGYKVDFIIDDGKFYHNDTILYHSKNSKIYYNFIFFFLRLRRKLEYYLWNIFIGSINHNFKFIRVSKIDKIKIIKNDDLINKYTKESMIRFFQNDKLDYNNNIIKWYKNKTIKNAILSYKISKYSNSYLSKDNKSFFLTSHGIYSLWGPAYEALDNKIKRIVYGPNFYQRKSISFFNNIHQVTNNELSLKEFIKKDLTKFQSEKINKYLKDRFSFKEKDTQVYFSNHSNQSNFFLNKKTDFNGKVFIAFPNIIWDGNVNSRDSIFSSISDWLIDLISFFKNNKKNSLIIRFHPAESTWFKGTKMFEFLLSSHLKGIENHRNIKIISSENNLNTYNLLKNYADYTLVYDGIIALESPYYNTPVLFAANGRFNVPNYGFQFNSKDDYFSFLNNPTNNKKTISDKIIAEKLFYYYMFENSRYFPVLDNEESDFGTDINIFKNKKELLKSSQSIMEGINKCL